MTKASFKRQNELLFFSRKIGLIYLKGFLPSRQYISKYVIYLFNVITNTLFIYATQEVKILSEDSFIKII